MKPLDPWTPYPCDPSVQICHPSLEGVLVLAACLALLVAALLVLRFIYRKPPHGTPPPGGVNLSADEVEATPTALDSPPVTLPQRAPTRTGTSSL
jgi:hypothetical protein